MTILNDRLFEDRAFAALFGMHDFEYTQIGSGGLITYSQDNKRQLIYHDPEIKRATVQKLVSQLERSLDTRLKKAEHEETIPCELLHVKKNSLIVEGNGFFLNHHLYHFKPNYDSLVGIYYALQYRDYFVDFKLNYGLSSSPGGGFP